MSSASLVEGKSDYSNAEFSGLYISCYSDGTLAEAEYFTDSGRIMTSSGTYRLRMIDDIEFNQPYVEYYPVDDNGRSIKISADTETGLNGKNISWSFPDKLGISGSSVVPNFKSTSEQLANTVPYVELVSSDNKITGIKYRNSVLLHHQSIQNPQLPQALHPILNLQITEEEEVAGDVIQ